MISNTVCPDAMNLFTPIANPSTGTFRIKVKKWEK